jgi:PTS system mannose-specific IIB component
LIHGQVAVAWRQHLRYNEISIVDDNVATDPFMRDVLRLAAPPDVHVTVATVQQAAISLTKPSSSAVLVLTRSPQTVLQLVNAKLLLTRINIGNLGAAPGRRRVLKSIALDPEHVAALDALAARGVRIAFQLVPHDTPIQWAKVREKWVDSK